MNAQQKLLPLPSARITSILLFYVLIVAAFFRFRGLFWGEYQYLHPDERFLVWVGTDISPVNTISDYFDTANSSLNPHNRGHGFYVYGTLPMFMARYLVEWIFGHSGFKEMTQVGRILSALADMFTVYLVFLVAKRLYDARVGLWAAALSACVVLQIQQAHFFTMDTFMNAFMLLAFYFAVCILRAPAERPELWRNPRNWIMQPIFLLSLAFGAALGMAVASKIDAAPMALALPLALGFRLWQLHEDERETLIGYYITLLALGALTSLFVFRLLQPYAFSGPGLLGIKPNPLWMSNIRELLAQSGGNVDFPPAMQWARRNHWFSFKNMLLWGLGLPLGLLAWGSFLWIAKRIFYHLKEMKPALIHHGLIWIWTATFFLWQSLRLNPTMRYQLPIYPTLTIIAAWGIVALSDRLPTRDDGNNIQRRKPWVGWAIGAFVLIATCGYALAFTRIYTQPITRVAASRWIYENIPGPINLKIRTSTGTVNQILSYPYSFILAPGRAYSRDFKPVADGTLESISFAYILDKKDSSETDTLKVTLKSQGNLLAEGTLLEDFPTQKENVYAGYQLTLAQPVSLKSEQSYSLTLEVPGEAESVTIGTELWVSFQNALSEGTEVSLEIPILLDSESLTPGQPLHFSLEAPGDGFLTSLRTAQLSLENKRSLSEARLELSVLGPLGELSSIPLAPTFDEQGEIAWLFLEQPVALIAHETYQMSLSIEPQGSILSLSGSGIANEGEWDDGLPLRLDGYDGFGGIYPPGLDFNMYWNDNQDKLERFIRIMNDADFILISSSRQWGSLPRIPERFPLVSIYYRHLLGCPEDEVIEYCYNIAKPDTYSGDLGFELIRVFQSNPTLGPFEINDQFAEEAFTVYDHPKVFIFKKTEAYDAHKVREILSQADFDRIIRKPPMQYASHPENLLLPDYRFAEQVLGGTWSKLFDTQAWHNRYSLLAALLWYVTLFILGLVVYPLLRRWLPGLEDKGYPFARLVALLLVSYLVWLAGNMRIPFTRLTISVVIGALTSVGIYQLIQQKDELIQEISEKKRYFIWVEGLFLAFFLLFILIRLGNPDLWHPWKGGEKPMDFAYFNAVLKSTSFPPYDPWYAGGYLNYYYYGFLLMGVLVKWLGITPAVAYNLILATLFAMIAMGAFSIVWNLTYRTPSKQKGGFPSSHFLASLAGSFGMAILGNLGTVKMFYQGFVRLAAPGGNIEGGNAFTHIVWAWQGFFSWLQGARLPYSIGDWYWNPSRIIPAPGDVEPITEFPFFTVLYGDPHAHLFALPLTLLAIAIPLSIVLRRAEWKSNFWAISCVLFAALAIGCLRPTNTWDFPTYLGLGVLMTTYGFWQRISNRDQAGRALRPTLQRLGVAAGAGLFLGIMAIVLFQPYAQWYALGYTKIDIWKGTHTPISAYLSHWGLFLFVILTWMAWETMDWMAKTPLSALYKLRSYQGLMRAGLVVIVLLIVGLLFMGVRIAWLVLPLAVWAGLLILRPRISPAKQVVLLLVVSGLLLTLMVEAIVLRGDIGRMNTVFKFYLQVWSLFAISAAASLGWLMRKMPTWAETRRTAWMVMFIFLVAGTAMYPLMASMAKIQDRMAAEAPHTLDGMAFMRYATYTDTWGEMDLEQDYQAIRWMQEHVQGSPVIVEANLRDLYRWGSRFSIYTGLPGVVGWEWHQQQQRAVVPSSWVSERIAEVDEFYLTTDWQVAKQFLLKYQVRYIILGQQERGHYAGAGLEKFEQADGILWREVYRYKDTVIYEVLLDGL